MRYLLTVSLLGCLLSCQDPAARAFSDFLGTRADTQFDWLIRGGTVIDGSGAPGTQQDVLIEGDRIVFAGTVDANRITAEKTVDASGKVVCPGFIDVHAHGNVVRDAPFRNFLAMGVTSISLGQDGSSPDYEDIGDWYAEAAKAQPAVNIIPFVGHGTLRSLSGEGLETNLSSLALEKMNRLLGDALQKGCFGMSTGLEYIPGTFAGAQELALLAKTVGQYDGMIMSHMRNEDDDALEASIAELLEQGQHCRVHVAHLKSVYGKGPERAATILGWLHAADIPYAVSADVYPYTASYTGIGILFPEWAKAPNDYRRVKVERRTELLDFLRSKVIARNGPAATLLGTEPYTGKTLEDLSREQNRPFEEILLDIGPTGASGAYFVMDEDLQKRLIGDPLVMISSDGSPTMNHPRGYGSFTKIIESYVQKDGLIPLETAIHKMSGLPAATLGIQDRGILAAGKKADILVFDPAAIRTKAEFAAPHQLSEGMDLVLVNGHSALERGIFSDIRKGIMLTKNNMQ